MPRSPLLVATAMLCLGGSVIARAAEPPSSKPMPDWIRGEVANYTLTPKGDVDGFVLADGTQVHVAPHLGAALVYTARPGEEVAVQGEAQAAGPVIEADEIRNAASGVVFVNTGPERSPEAPQTETVEGRIAFVLHGPKGDVDGAILTDGTVLHLPPKAGAKDLAPGRAVTAAGRSKTTPMAKVVEVHKLTPARDGS
ncbi:MAG: hypothetical protein AB7I59_05590 [Geminicoccaceae bacterium]